MVADETHLLLPSPLSLSSGMQSGSNFVKPSTRRPNSGYLNSSTFGRKESCSTRKSMAAASMRQRRSKRIVQRHQNHFDACRDRHWRRVLQKPACGGGKDQTISRRRLAGDCCPGRGASGLETGFDRPSVANLGHNCFLSLSCRIPIIAMPAFSLCRRLAKHRLAGRFFCRARGPE